MTVLVGCIMARDSMPQIDLAVRSTLNVVDRLIVLDAGSIDGTAELTQSLGVELVHRPWTGNFGVQRTEFVSHISQWGLAESVWMLIVDSDEIVIGGISKSQLDGWTNAGIDNAWLQRRWVVRHRGTLKYIASAPHTPDWANRLVRFRPDLRFEGTVHDHPRPAGRGARMPCEVMRLLHLDLVLRGRVERQQKMLRYCDLEKRAAYPWYELYEDYGYFLDDLDAADSQWSSRIQKIAVTDSRDNLVRQHIRYWLSPKGFVQHVAKPRGRRLREMVSDCLGRK